jgi:hypothetical protein
MPTHATETRGVGTAAKEVAERASALARLEMELAALELRRKVKKLGLGIGLGAGAALFALFALGFGLAAAAAAIATAVSTWVALLIVFGGLVLVALLLGLFALSAIRSASPPVPEQALEEARLTTETLRSDGSH